MSKLKNIHPGEILLEEFLLPFEISAYRLSKDIGIPQTRISEIIKGNRRITADTALRLSKYFNNLEDAEKLYNKIIAEDPDDLWLELTKSDDDDDYEVLQEYKNIEEESSDDDSSVHSDHSIAVDEVIKL